MRVRSPQRPSQNAEQTSGPACIKNACAPLKTGVAQCARVSVIRVESDCFGVRAEVCETQLREACISRAHAQLHSHIWSCPGQSCIGHKMHSRLWRTATERLGSGPRRPPHTAAPVALDQRTQLQRLAAKPQGTRGWGGGGRRFGARVATPPATPTPRPRRA